MRSKFRKKVNNEVILKQIKTKTLLDKHRSVKTPNLQNGLVAGIERNGKRLLNSESNIVLEKMIFYGCRNKKN
jgi:hypothetical protein